MEKIVVDKDNNQIKINGLHLVRKDVNFRDIIVLDDEENVVYITINEYGDYRIRYTGLKIDKFLLNDFIFHSTNTYYIQ